MNLTRTEKSQNLCQCTDLIMSVPEKDPNWVEPAAEVCHKRDSQVGHTNQVRLADEGVYCVCRTRDDGSFMILCEYCEDWFHGKCVGIRERDGPLVDVFVCPNCTKLGKGISRIVNYC